VKFDAPLIERRAFEPHVTGHSKARVARATGHEDEQ
jgi:hypothetical protein